MKRKLSYNWQKIRLKILKQWFLLQSKGLRFVIFKRLNRQRLSAMFGLVMMGCAALSMLVFSTVPVQAASHTVSNNEILDGYVPYGQIDADPTAGTIKLQKGEVGSWNQNETDNLQNLPTMVYGTTDMTYGPNNTIYYITNFANACRFLKYDIEFKTWEALKSVPYGCGSAAQIMYDNVDSVYYMPGNNTGRLYKYNIGTNSWSRLSDMPTQVAGNGSAKYVTRGGNSYIYLFRGAGSTSFWRYAVATDTWDNLTAFPTTSSVGAGIVLAWDGGDSIYAITNDVGEFQRYSITTNSWTALPRYSSYSDKRLSMVHVNGSLYLTMNRYNGNRVTLLQYNIAAGVWNEISIPAPANVRDWPQSIIYDGSRYLYMQVGSDYRPQLFRYDVVAQTWNTNSLFVQSGDTQFRVDNIAYDGAQSVYFVGGTWDGGRERVFKYDLATQSTTIVGAQFNTSVGYASEYYNGSIYFGDNNSTVFASYNPETNAWNTLAPSPLTMPSGSSLINGGDGYLYAQFGGNRRNFYRYNVATNVWESRATIPTVGVNQSAGMTRIGRYLYLMHGNNTAYFSRYNMDTNTWNAIDGMPSGAVDWGGFITGDSARYVYICPGGRFEKGNKFMYRYDTVTMEWKKMADMPAATNVGAQAFYDTVNGKVYVAQGRQQSKLWSWSPSSANFVSQGTWYSKTYEFSQVQSWGALEYTTSGTGSVTLYTRTSANGRLWSNWQAVSGSTIASPANKYIMIKAVLSGDGSQTPTLSNIKINYNQETQAPSLPSQFFAYSKKDGAQLSSGQTYEWQHPYFAWDGAADNAGGAGVAGYYVYFGTNSGADPVTAGSYQTTKNYTVTAPMTAGDVYYVRIKVADKLGNISDAATFFSYRYFYISPPGEVVKTSDGDFSAGENVDLTINNGAMSLKKQDTGAWSTGTIDPLPERARGGGMAMVGDFLYMLRGNNSNTFWRYDTVGRAWETMAAAPDTINPGSALSWDKNNYLYAFRGGSTNAFYRYSIQDNVWETLGNLPANAQQGADIAYIGNGQLALFFVGPREFYTYDIAERNFVIRASYPSQIDYGGAGIWFDGADSIYANMGLDNWWDSSNNSRDVFAKYSISTDTWRSLAQPPVGPMYSQQNLVSDGSGNLYIFGSDELNSTYRDQVMLQYNIANDEWKEVPGFPSQMRTGSATSDEKRYLYVAAARDGYSTMLVKYDSWDNVFYPSVPYAHAFERVTWDWASNAYNLHIGEASTVAYDGNRYMYILSRNQSNDNFFTRYDIKTGSHIKLPSAIAVGIGGSLEFIGGKLYYAPGLNGRDFYNFDFVQERWLRMTDVPVNNYRPGPSTLVNVNGTGYFLPGNGSSFYRYQPNGSGGTWTSMASLPAGMIYGSATADTVNGKIYVLRGNNTNSFYVYDIASNSWSTLANLPVNTAHGSAMVMSNGKIYTIRGSDSTDTFIYDIASNTWTPGATAPGLARHGTNFIKISNTAARYFPSNYNSDIWEFKFPDTNQAYEGFAQHTSLPMTVQGMFDYAGIEATVQLPTNTKVEFWTRSSDDANTWDDWKITDQVKYYNGKMSARVASKARKYTQIRVMLYSRDNLYTPVVSDFRMSYYFDIDPPQNPSTMTAYQSDARVNELTTNVWYNHAQPVFDWPDPGQPGGATDGPLGSNMAGYWVYLGPDETATPRTAGTFVTASEYKPNLTVSGNYFLRIQAQDLTGNADPQVYAPFVYKFDNTRPTSPNLITVTPGGYTTTNRYSFNWPAAFDAHSGVYRYCYYTGASSGPFATEQCQSERELLDVSAAYRTGTNVFYLRTLDRAGNYSAAYTTVSYYYSTDPPSPPTNLRAIPPTSSQNLFAFTWDLPALYSGDPDQLTYCYSINILPGPTNSTCTGDRFISAFKAATRQGTNIIYMVTKDEAGNVNWNNYATSNFIANTVSPGIPLNLVVSDTSDQQAGRWSLTATWNKPTFEGNGISHYLVERSPDGHTFERIGITSTTAFVDLEVEPTTTYYYRVRASDNVDNAGGPSGTVSGTPRGNYGTPPNIVVEPTASAESGQAIVRWATSRESTSFVYYGTSPTSLSQSKGTLDLVADHEQTITGLLPSTIYYFRVQSFDNERSYDLQNAFSNIYSFKTTESAQVYNVSVDSITLNSAVISWQTSVPTRTRIDYGTSLAYDSSAAEEGDVASVNHFFKLNNLSSGSLYHFRIVSKTALGTTIYSDDYTLQTIARPTIRNVKFQPIEDAVTASVRVTWDTNVPTTTTLRYRGTGTSLERSTGELTTSHEVVIDDLASSTDYLFNAEGRDQYGNLVTSEEQRWQSSYDTRAPKVSDVSVSMTTTEGTSKTRAQVIVSWKTDEPSTSQVEYRKAKGGDAKLTALDTEPTTNHVVVISNLDLAEIYRVKVISKDLSGNSVYGRQTSVVTPDQETTVLDAVLTVLQRIFRF